MKMNGVEIAEVSEKGTVGKSVEVFGDCCSRISLSVLYGISCFPQMLSRENLLCIWFQDSFQ